MRAPAVLLLIASAGLAGCTFPSSRTTVSRTAVNVMQNVDLGTVTHVQEVTIEGQKTPLGMFGGGVIGSAVTSGGDGVGGAVVQAVGTVAGAVAGQAVEEAATRRRAQAITVHLDDGRTVVVTQEHRGGVFRDGDRVRILNGSGHDQVAMDVGP